MCAFCKSDSIKLDSSQITSEAPRCKIQSHLVRIERLDFRPPIETRDQLLRPLVNFRAHDIVSLKWQFSEDL